MNNLTFSGEQKYDSGTVPPPEGLGGACPLGGLAAPIIVFLFICFLFVSDYSVQILRNDLRFTYFGLFLFHKFSSFTPPAWA